jgi:hypothetical protein
LDPLLSSDRRFHLLEVVEKVERPALGVSESNRVEKPRLVFEVGGFRFEEGRELPPLDGSGEEIDRSLEVGAPIPEV